ncbi:Fe-S cluster assembly ATPase SufC [Candidatus Woesebacteria bacterium]|nr:Fe-S cluster assembly ATPase SufC [Candidatus Woesebacteria bacterium]
MLQLTKLSVQAGGKTIISNFTHTFKKGKVYAVMGPNGSGKSTLAYSIMGNPAYEASSARFVMSNGKGEKIDLTDLKPDERAKAGIFLSFQTPLSLQGVRVTQLLQLALDGAIPALELRRKVAKIAEELHIQPELLQRSLNESASGGERKKMEVLQAAVLDKQIQIFDEIDTGVDVDALRHIGKFLHARRKDKTYIIITHYNRILKYLPPDEVIVMMEGKIVKVGDAKLAKAIEKDGYTQK